MQNIEQIYNKQECCGCTACVNVCPVNAIKMVYESGFLYPKIDNDKCINCGKCLLTCEGCSKEKIKFTYEKPKALYGFTYNDVGVLKRSSSGGFFYWLSSYIINQGGVVCSPAFDKDWSVHHIFIDRIEEIEQVQGSKYVQSDKEFVYRNVEGYLKQGRSVLFCGTPCEISGLKNTIVQSKCDKEKLVLCEVICRGGNSPLLLAKFVNYLQSKYGDIEKINFREKTYGYRSSTLTVKCRKKVYHETYDNGLFLPAFFKDLSVRESCTKCKYKNIASNADFTIGDYWKGQDGTTIVSCNSEKSIKIMEVAREDIKVQCFETTIEDALITNSNGNIKNGRWIYPTRLNENRESFVSDIEKKSIIHLRKIYYPLTLKMLVKRGLRPVRYKIQCVYKKEKKIR